MAYIWIFGYGSLMWDYGEYNPIKIVDATLSGAHRSFNRKSTQSRGTKRRPGLVLGLEKGGNCKGKAIFIDKRYEPTIDKREGAGKAYLKITTPKLGLKVLSQNQELPSCIVYISNPDSSNYIGERLSIEEKAQMAINAESGERGNSVDYIKETYRLCKRQGINDPNLKEMYNKIRRLLGEESHAHTHILSSAITDVEVYDSPSQYGNRYRINNDDLIIGLPKEIRNALHLTGKWDSNETVVVHNGFRKLIVKAVQTDSRLTSNGSCKADNPANHCWMTPSVRNQLHIKALSREHWVHRINYSAFKIKFKSVKITKK